MMKRSVTVAGLAFILFFIAGFWVGCIVDYDEQLENAYACVEDKDCIQPRFVCGPEKLCIVYEPAGPQPCIDNDGDGYGAAGTDRSNCPHPEPDCDDDDPEVYPGAPEVCDGKLNDCNAEEIDVAPCKQTRDCPQGQTDPEGHRISYSCENEVCIAKSPNTICIGPNVEPCPECLEPLACVDGVLDIVPERCR